MSVDKLDWFDQDNLLLLNSRLPAAVRLHYEKEWNRLVEPEFKGHIGIASSGSSQSNKFNRVILIAKTALLASAAAVNRHLQSTRHDAWMKTLPDFHVGGLSVYSRSRLNGARVIESQLKKWEVSAFHRELSESGATLLSLVPTQLFDLVQSRLKSPHSLRYVIIGGGRLEPRLAQRAVELGWPVLASYGLTECGSQVATAREIGSEQLWPLDHVEVKIHPNSPVELKEGMPNAPGRIGIRSPALFSAELYFDDLGKGEIRRRPSGDGFFVTEDRGELLSNGELLVFGRDSGFVKIGGESVSLLRLEDIFEKLRFELFPELDGALIAEPDARLGHQIQLFMSRAQSDDESELGSRTLLLVRAYNHHVLPFERIRKIHVIAKLPRSPLGKILKNEALRAERLQSFSDL